MKVPLPDRIRPQSLNEYIGQEHLVGEGKLLRKAIEQGKIFSMILWGPPGVGKTTLARLIAKETESPFYEFSAVTTGIAEIKKVIESASSGLFTPIVFVDEIHRFNKAQQDAFLPLVESGKIIFVGATTENPSFEIIRPLLSRLRVLVLKPLEEKDFELMIERALRDEIRGLGMYRAVLAEGVKNYLIGQSRGDGRWLLMTLELAVDYAISSSEVDDAELIISKEIIVEAMQEKKLGHDKSGDAHYDLISAFIKSMRASNVDAALYYLARMVEGGEDALFIARRMVIFASEDVGMAQPTALVIANEVFRACETIGYPECAINLAQGAVYLAKCPKERKVYDGIMGALQEVRGSGELAIPMKLRNVPTGLMKSLGYGKGYEMYGDEELLPNEILGKKFF
ncbi:MAG: ATPase AAA [Patescibacteria group bacterium]|nr:MAG: ATPase AAA [Patescibacteria group bacterium]